MGGNGDDEKASIRFVQTYQATIIAVSVTLLVVGVQGNWLNQAMEDHPQVSVLVIILGAFGLFLGTLGQHMSEADRNIQSQDHFIALHTEVTSLRTELAELAAKANDGSTNAD